MSGSGLCSRNCRSAIYVSDRRYQRRGSRKGKGCVQDFPTSKRSLLTTLLFTISLVPSTSRGTLIASAVGVLPSLQIRICVLHYRCSTVIPLAVPSILFPPSFHWGGGFLLHSPQLTVTRRAPPRRLWVGCASAYSLQQLHFSCNYWRKYGAPPGFKI